MHIPFQNTHNFWFSVNEVKYSFTSKENLPYN